jgi:hypothetical protein
MPAFMRDLKLEGLIDAYVSSRKTTFGEDHYDVMARYELPDGSRVHTKLLGIGSPVRSVALARAAAINAFIKVLPK